MNNPHVSHIPLPGGSVYSPSPRPNFAEIEERMERESAAKKDEFESGGKKERVKKANILKRVNCQIKNLDEVNAYSVENEEAVKKNNWKQKDGTFGFLMNDSEKHSDKHSDKNPDKNSENVEPAQQEPNKWQNKGHESFKPAGIDVLEPIFDEKIMENIFKPKPIPARSKWGAKKDTLVQKLDDLTLQQVILEDNSISPEKPFRATSPTKTRMISGESNSSSSQSSNLSPVKSLNLTPTNSMSAHKYSENSCITPISPMSPNKSDSLEIINLQPVRTSGTPTIGSPIKPATPIKSQIDANHDSDVDSISSNATETVGAAEDILPERDHEISKIEETESNTFEEDVTLMPDAKKNILDILGAGDATISKTAVSDKTHSMISESENELYESDFDGSSGTDFEELNDENDESNDETKYFEDTANSTEHQKSESLLHPEKDKNILQTSIQYQSPAKPHETSSIFEALECLRIELETELGFSTFSQIYSSLESNEDDPPLNEFKSMLGEEKFETYYPKIFKLYMNDGIYYDQ